MDKIFSILKKRYFKPKVSNETLKKTSIANKIDELCSQYLKDASDILTFEVTDTEDSQYAIIVITEEPLISKYIISQIDETCFEARLRVINF